MSKPAFEVSAYIESEGLVKESEIFALLQNPTFTHANLLRGTIALTKLQALHYAGVTAIEGWRELIGWDEDAGEIAPTGERHD